MIVPCNCRGVVSELDLGNPQVIFSTLSQSEKDLLPGHRTSGSVGVASMPPRQENPIETPRLLLLTVTEAALEADRSGKGLGEVLGVIVPATWPPQFWDAKAIEYLYGRIQRTPHYLGWCRYIALKQPTAAPVLIGGCGSTESPETREEVDIGYSILKEFRRHGYVTEALEGLIPWIFTHSPVHSVCAQTYSHLAASIGVLRKCGFVLAGTGRDPGTVLFRRMRVIEE